MLLELEDGIFKVAFESSLYKIRFNSCATIAYDIFIPQIKTIPSNNTIIHNPPFILVHSSPLLQSISKKKSKISTYFQPVGLGVTAVVAPRQLRPSAFHRDYGCIDPGVTPSSPFRHFPPPATLHSSPLLSARRHPRAASWPEVADDNEPPLPPQQQPLSTTPPDPAPIKPSATPPPPPAIDTARRRRGQVDGGEDVMLRWIVAIPSSFLLFYKFLWLFSFFLWIDSVAFLRDALGLIVR